jgi:2,3-dihydroxyphenylpropionate 1,2-dioxygenase
LRGLNDPSPEIIRDVDAALAKARAEVEAYDPELIICLRPTISTGCSMT